MLLQPQLRPIMQHEPDNRWAINPANHHKHGHPLQASKEQHEFLEILLASIHRRLHDAIASGDPCPRRANLLAEPGARGLLHNILFYVHCDFYCIEPASKVPDQKPNTSLAHNSDDCHCQSLVLHWLCRLLTVYSKMRLDFTNRVLRQHSMLHP
jgi:hypothetical protein